jgi:hypothetical protein
MTKPQKLTSLPPALFYDTEVYAREHGLNKDQFQDVVLDYLNIVHPVSWSDGYMEAITDCEIKQRQEAALNG